MLPNRPNHVKMPKWVKKVWNLLNILVPSSKILTLKSPCKSALQNKPFADVSDPSGHSFPSGPWNYVVPYTTCQTTKKRRQMLEMIRAKMSSVIRMIPSHLLSWSVICKIKIYLCLLNEQHYSSFQAHRNNSHFVSVSNLKNEIYVICRPGGPFWEKMCQRS